MQKELKEYIGKNIRAARQSKGLTIEALAEATGISDSFLGLVERSESGLSIDVLIKIAKVLEVSTDELLIHGAGVSKKREKSTNRATLITLIQASTDAEIDFMLDFYKLFKRQHFKKKEKGKDTEDE